MNSPLLSIIIPTRNRYVTLISVVNALEKYFYDYNVEIVIQDNSDDNSIIQNYLENHHLRKVKYYYNSTKLSMVDNSELAISNSKGRYLIFIGDDDIVIPSVMKVIEAMEEYNMESVIYPIANYFYPDVKFHKEYGFNKSSTLSFVNNIQYEYFKLDTKIELARVEAMGGIFIADLPRLYHGIVRRDIVQKIKITYGKYVPGPCPDMTTSAALAVILNNHFKINLPISIAGNSSLSEGGKGPTNSHVVKLEDKSWLNMNDVKDWSSKLPRIFSRETIWAQSLFHVLSLSRKPNLNYKSVYDSMIFTAPRKILGIINDKYLNDGPFVGNFLGLIKAYIKRYLRLFIYNCPTFFIEFLMSVRGDYKSKQVAYNVMTIEECVKVLENKIKI